MKALIDADILRYEVGFAGEAAIKAASQGEETIPSWEWIENILFERFNRILRETNADDYAFYLTCNPSFRDNLATVKPYKGQRVTHRPWHYSNLSAFIKQHFNCIRARGGLEADDEIAIAHSNDTVVCSRDKDLKQLPGWSYSWELGRQPRWGPSQIDQTGWVELSENRKALVGEGHMWFYGQLLVGDKADNIPGVEKCGPVAAYGMLQRHKELGGAWEAVKRTYYDRYKKDWRDRLTEQARLLYLVREYPFELWTIEQEEAKL